MNKSDRLLLQDELSQDALSSLMATIQGQSDNRESHHPTYRPHHLN